MGKKVVFIIHTLGSGGAERVTITIGEYCYRCGYDVHFIIFQKSNNEYCIDNGIPCYYMHSKHNKVFDVFSKRIELQKILHSINPDYVIALGVYRHIFFSGIYRKYKCVFSERNDPSRVGLIDRIIKKRCFKKSYKMVFQTPDAMSYYDKTIQKKGCIIYNPITENLPAPYFGKREDRIVACCRLEKQKNIPLMLDAFRAFLINHPGYVLEIYGEGSLLDSLKEYCAKLGIEKQVFFLGFINPLHARIIKASMYVSSSDYEGISNSMLEALAIGIPVVCTDCPVGGARLFVEDGINGKLVPLNDVDAFQNAMSYVVQSDEVNLMLSKNATAIRNKLKNSVICEKWIELLAE